MGAPDHQPQHKPANYLEGIARLRELFEVDYKGTLIPFASVMILAIIHNENQQTGNLCKKGTIVSQFKTNSKNGTTLSILESKGLINKINKIGYWATAEGEYLLRFSLNKFARVVENKPTKRKRVIDPNQRPRQKPPIETFEQLVSETLNKKGLNKRVKYALLRTLGMKKDQAQQALKIITPLKHTERIKPVLKNILIDLINNTEPENTKG